jgi:uncharacterized membrane protein YeiH
LTALGGGTIRECILHGTPGYLLDNTYLGTVIIGVAFAVAVHTYFVRINKYMLVIDAVGVAVFAYIGALRADQAGMGLGAMIFFAVLTAAGGGVLSDIVSRCKPEAFYKDFYPLAAILLAIAYYIVRPTEQDSVAALLLIAAAFVARVVSMWFKITLWVPHKRKVSPAVLLLWLRTVNGEVE